MSEPTRLPFETASRRVTKVSDPELTFAMGGASWGGRTVSRVTRERETRARGTLAGFEETRASIPTASFREGMDEFDVTAKSCPVEINWGSRHVISRSPIFSMTELDSLRELLEATNVAATERLGELPVILQRLTEFSEVLDEKDDSILNKKFIQLICMPNKGGHAAAKQKLAEAAPQMGLMGQLREVVYLVEAVVTEFFAKDEVLGMLDELYSLQPHAINPAATRKFKALSTEIKGYRSRLGAVNDSLEELGSEFSRLKLLISSKADNPVEVDIFGAPLELEEHAEYRPVESKALAVFKEFEDFADRVHLFKVTDCLFTEKFSLLETILDLLGETTVDISEHNRKRRDALFGRVRRVSPTMSFVGKEEMVQSRRRSASEVGRKPSGKADGGGKPRSSSVGPGIPAREGFETMTSSRRLASLEEVSNGDA